MNTDLKLTIAHTGAAITYTVRDAPDWSILVNRVLTKRFGMTAAKNRQDIRETDFPVRTWSGVVDGTTCTIEEPAPHPAIAEVIASVETVRSATAALTAAQTARDDSVRAALTAGVSVKDLSPASSLSKERIYQIRDNRR